MFYWILNELSTPFVPGLQDAKGIQINVPRKRIRSSCVRYLHDVHVSFLSLWLKFFMHRTPKRLRISVACPPKQASSIISYIYQCLPSQYSGRCWYWRDTRLPLGVVCTNGFEAKLYGIYRRFPPAIPWLCFSLLKPMLEVIEGCFWLLRSTIKRLNWIVQSFGDDVPPNFWNEEDFNRFNLISLVASVVSRDEL